MVRGMAWLTNTILPRTARIGRGVQRFERVEADDLAGDPLRRRRAAVAERGDDQPLREGREDLGALRAAGPHRHVERLDPDVGETERLQPGDRPVARAGFGLGPGEPLADLGGEPFDDVPGIIVLQRGIAQRGDLRVGRSGDGGCWASAGAAEASRSAASKMQFHVACLGQGTSASHDRRSIKSAHWSIKAAASGRPPAAGTGRCAVRTWPGAGRISWPRSRTGCGAARPTVLARASG